MAISYSAIVGWNSGKATLPSVESWSSNLNILRDPPKSIYTRKIDRVGQTSEITQMIQDSGDRAAECIQVYQRGVNPMVAVDFSNSGNNGGQRGGSRQNAGLSYGNLNNSKQSYLPYRILDKGAFRPPIRDQRSLLPLSRLPRVWTSSFSQPGFADFSKKAMCPGNIGDDYKGVKSSEQMLKACARPTATYKIQTPLIEPYEVKYVIKNPMKVPVSSGVHVKARFNGELGEPVKQINNDPLRKEIHINQRGEHSREVDVDRHETERYTHDALQGSYGSNLSQNVQITPIDEIFAMDASKNIQNAQNISYNAPQTSYKKYEYIHDDVELERSLPYYEAHTNIGDKNTYKRLDNQTVERVYSLNRPMPEAITNIGGNHMQTVDNISSRQYNLKPTVNPGGFDGAPTMPTFNRENNLIDVDNDKSRMRQRIFEMQQDRAVSIGNIPYSVE